MRDMVQTPSCVAVKRKVWPMDAHSTIARLDESGLDGAADVLARAFFDDPFAVYVVPDPADREDLLYWYYGTIVQYGLLHGEVYTTADGGGVAVWLPQDGTDSDGEHLEQSGLLDAPEVLGMAAFGRLVSIMGSLNRIRHQLVHGPHWDLPAIGVDPAYQGRGIGSALLRPMLARAGRENRPCYLETFRARNTAFYRRYGFVSRAAEVHAESGLRFWGMRRDPAREGGG